MINCHHSSAWVCRVVDRLLTWAWRHFGCTIFKMHRKALLPPGESVKMFDLCGRASFFSTSVIKCAPLCPRRPGGWPPGASVAQYCAKSPFYLSTEIDTINALSNAKDCYITINMVQIYTEWIWSHQWPERASATLLQVVRRTSMCNIVLVHINRANLKLETKG